MRRIALTLALFAAISAVGAGLAVRARPDPAPARMRVCHPCSMPAFGVRAPRHGVLLARGGVYAAGTDYLLLDFDARRLTQGSVARGDGGPAQSAPMRVADITAQEAAALAELANRIWAEPQPLPSTGASDVFWEAWLSDGAVTRRERGPGNPPGLADALERRMLDVLSNHRPAPRGAG